MDKNPVPVGKGSHERPGLGFVNSCFTICIVLPLGSVLLRTFHHIVVFTHCNDFWAISKHNDMQHYSGEEQAVPCLKFGVLVQDLVYLFGIHVIFTVFLPYYKIEVLNVGRDRSRSN